MTPFLRCLIKCLEKDLPVHYLVIGRGSGEECRGKVYSSAFQPSTMPGKGFAGAGCVFAHCINLMSRFATMFRM